MSGKHMELLHVFSENTLIKLFIFLGQNEITEVVNVGTAISHINSGT